MCLALRAIHPWVQIHQPNTKPAMKVGILFGGRGGIRTHGTVSGTLVFKTSTINRSVTLPTGCDYSKYIWITE